MVQKTANIQWIFLVPLKGGRWHSPSPNWQEIHTTYIPLIVLAEPGGLYATDPTFYGNQKQPLTSGLYNHLCGATEEWPGMSFVSRWCPGHLVAPVFFPAELTYKHQQKEDVHGKMQGVGWISVGKVLETNFSTSGYLFDLLELEF